MMRTIHRDGIELRVGLVESGSARLYVEDCGRGRPLVLVHGWTMSGRVWQRQMTGLSDRFRLVIPDLRAHGRSSKVMDGLTVAQAAEDVHRVIEALELDRPVLAGWSLAGPVVLEYWRRFGGDNLAGLGLIEMTPHPLDDGEWNTHSLRNYNYDGLAGFLARLETDRPALASDFIDGMYYAGQAPAGEKEWFRGEHFLTPAPAAAAIYSDYVGLDLTGVLPTIDCPVLVTVGDSAHHCFGPLVGCYLADSLSRAELRIYDRSGHLPFWEQAEEFNRDLARFIMGL